MLLEMRVKDLKALCQLAGIPHSGAGERLAHRLMDAATLRVVLAPFELDEDAPHEAQTVQVQRLADAFTARRLHAMCRTAGVFAPGTKYGKAAALLQWRNACRRRGQEKYATARAQAQAAPHTLRMKLD